METIEKPPRDVSLFLGDSLDTDAVENWNYIPKKMCVDWMTAHENARECCCSSSDCQDIYCLRPVTFSVYSMLYIYFVVPSDSI